MTGKLLFQDRTILVTNRHWDEQGWRIVHVNVARLDEGFRRDPRFYIGRGRGDYWLQRLADMEEMVAPIVYVDADGLVTFEDGRHRYAALRDAGHAKIPVAMNAESRANARKNGYLRRP